MIEKLFSDFFSGGFMPLFLTYRPNLKHVSVLSGNSRNVSYDYVGQKAALGIGKVSHKDLVDQIHLAVLFSTGKHTFIQLNCH